jgi:hypothetical protein
MHDPIQYSPSSHIPLLLQVCASDGEGGREKNAVNAARRTEMDRVMKAGCLCMAIFRLGFWTKAWPDIRFELITVRDIAGNQPPPFYYGGYPPFICPYREKSGKPPRILSQRKLLIISRSRFWTQTLSDSLASNKLLKVSFGAHYFKTFRGLSFNNFWTLFISPGYELEVRSLRKELPDQAVGVLIGTPLPWTLRIGEVDLRLGILCEKLVLIHFTAAVVGKRKFPLVTRFQLLLQSVFLPQDSRVTSGGKFSACRQRLDGTSFPEVAICYAASAWLQFSAILKGDFPATSLKKILASSSRADFVTDFVLPKADFVTDFVLPKAESQTSSQTSSCRRRTSSRRRTDFVLPKADFVTDFVLPKADTT